MSYAPHSDNDVEEMLAYIGCKKIEDLFDEVPEQIRIESLNGVSKSTSEMAISRDFKKKMDQDKVVSNFIGAGSYEHYSPPTVWDLVFRGEFLTSYTPYQAEASQGSLQLIYEYQTMMTQITGLDVSNASLYDGASALAEAALMAIRSKGKKAVRRILLPTSVNPNYREVVKTIIEPQGIEVKEVDYDKTSGLTSLGREICKDYDALIISQPNFMGCLEDVDGLTNLAQSEGALVIGLVNPISCFLYKSPGSWGDKGADIACGEGQALGIPLSSGGPYYGFLTAKQDLVRHMPGRVVGKTVDAKGKSCYTLTLQAREQHIRRSKATSNICTNQGLMVTASTIYMSLMGAEGIRRVALASNQKANDLKERLASLGCKILFNQPFFCEFVIDAGEGLKQLREESKSLGISIGYELGEHYPELKGAVLCCVTDVKTEEQLDSYINLFSRGTSVR